MILNWVREAKAEALSRMKEIPPVFRGLRVPKFTEGLKAYPGKDIPRSLAVALGLHVAFLDRYMRERESSAGHDYCLGDFCKNSVAWGGLDMTHASLPLTQHGVTKHISDHEGELPSLKKSGKLPAGYSPDNAALANYTSLDLVTMFLRRQDAVAAAAAEKDFAKRVAAEYRRIFGDGRPADKADFLRPFAEMTGFSLGLPELEGLLKSCGVCFDKREAKIVDALTDYISKYGIKDINWHAIHNAVDDYRSPRTPGQFHRYVKQEIFDPYYHYYLSDYAQPGQEGMQSKKKRSPFRADHVPPREISDRFIGGDLQQAMQEDIARGRRRRGITGTPMRTKYLPRSARNPAAPQRPTDGRRADNKGPGSHHD